jgi:hypothetical protein
MALASGIGVPAVFLLEKEDSINAFAAGFTPDDAVIGVNRGTLNYLTRDELQAVMAHEFSHILNGDMRLNLRLIGLLNGILLLAIIGYYCFRFSGMSGSSGGRRDKSGAAFVVLGLATMIIGYIGLFFGRLIKAAVSRQREYLADAAAVQFTRNPEGMSGALKKIGGLSSGSRMKTPEAETASHMFFGSAFGTWMFAPFSTHPPLPERIRRIEPTFSGEFPPTKPLVQPSEKKRGRPAAARVAGFGLGKTMKIPGLERTIPLDPLLVMASIGSLDTRAMNYSAGLLESLPGPLAEAIYDPFGSRIVIFALLLDTDEEICKRQLQLIQGAGDEAVKSTMQLAPLIRSLGPEARLPIIELAQGTLRGLSERQYRDFRELVHRLVQADGKITLLEFVIQRVLLQHLDRHFLQLKPPRTDFYSVKAVVRHVVPILSTLAHAGHRSADEAESAFRLAVNDLQPEVDDVQLLPLQQCSPDLMDQALQQLARCSPQVKQRLLRAAAVCAAADQNVTVYEAELLRAIAVSLDCPMGPLAANADNPSTSDPAPQTR